jgi:hypothetical protein
MPQQNADNVLYAVENANLSYMLTVVFFMCSMSFPLDAVDGLLVGPTCQWGERGNPFLPPPQQLCRRLPMYCELRELGPRRLFFPAVGDKGTVVVATTP